MLLVDLQHVDGLKIFVDLIAVIFLEAGSSQLVRISQTPTPRIKGNVWLNPQIPN